MLALRVEAAFTDVAQFYPPTPPPLPVPGQINAQDN